MALHECIKTCTWENKLYEGGKFYDFPDKGKPFVYQKEKLGKTNKMVIAPHPYLIEIKEEKPKEEKPKKKVEPKKDE